MLIYLNIVYVYRQLHKGIKMLNLIEQYQERFLKNFNTTYRCRQGRSGTSGSRHGRPGGQELQGKNHRHDRYPRYSEDLGESGGAARDRDHGAKGRSGSRERRVRHPSQK